jgi:hypothetical protein
LSVENGCHCHRCVCLCSYLFPSVVRYLDTKRHVENKELIQFNCCFPIWQPFYLEIGHYKVSAV